MPSVHAARAAIVGATKKREYRLSSIGSAPPHSNLTLPKRFLGTEQQKKVIEVETPPVQRLKQRLWEICAEETVVARDAMLSLLISETRSDIRCCLNTLQLLSADRLEITEE